ncbi:MAG: PilZ domain-containing protein [Deltaproteobacteria bacterium]|nr:PilZ domain-containing protein [Deltaproteobacteria bacterium]
MKTLRMDRRLLRWFNVSLGGRLKAVTVDVSEFGFCAELDPVFLPGSEVEGDIQVRDQVFRFRGLVSWAQAGRRHEKRSRIGVRFTHVPEAFARSLYGYTAAA